jgi:hypothetical protein
MEMDMSWAPGRAPYVALGDLPAPLSLDRHAIGTATPPAIRALERCRAMGNPRLDAARAADQLPSTGSARVCKGVSLITFGALDAGFLVVAQNRIMPFPFRSQGSLDGTIAALRTLVPSFAAIAQAPWFLVEGSPLLGQWADTAIAPPWLAVRQACLEAENRLQAVLAGFAISQGFTSGCVHLIGGRFDAHGRFVPPRFGYRPTGGATLDQDVPGFDPHRLWPGPFPFLHQTGLSFGGGVDTLHVEDLAGLSAHARTPYVRAFLSALNTHPSPSLQVLA